MAYTALNSYMLNQILPFSFRSVLFITFTHVLSWFFHFSKQKIPGLFKDFLGPFLENFKDFSMTIYLTRRKMFVLNDTGLALWHSTKPHFNEYRNLQRMRTWKHVQTRHALFACSSTYMRESSKREHWEWKTHVFTHFMTNENGMLCLPEHLFSVAFIHSNALRALTVFNLVPQQN